MQVVALTDQRRRQRGRPASELQGLSGIPRAAAAGAPVQNYKVQVGKFEDRSQAEQVAGRLKKEEQFQPWILR